MKYEAALDYLMNQLPVYQKTGKSAYRGDLSNALQLDAHVGHAHQQFPSIHIAGTNGKGSVSSMLASVLQESGYRTGLFTSPHLLDFRERIRINGQCIDKKFVTEFVSRHHVFFQQLSPSFFEISVFLAFSYFASRDVDIAIIETGLGGRLDTTNIISPILTVITNIGMDHTQILGGTLEKIAREKAGIIKDTTPLVVGRTQVETLPIFTCEARKKQAPIYIADKLYKTVSVETSNNPHPETSFTTEDQQTTQQQIWQSDLSGECQAENINTTLQSIELLREAGYSIAKQAVQSGLQQVIRNTGLLGRWQTIASRPDVICDVAHNHDGLSRIMKAIEALTHPRKHLLLGFVDDKELDGLWSLLPKDCQIYLSAPSIERRMPLDKLLQQAEKKQVRISAHFGSVAEAYEKLREQCQPDDLLFVGGSTFMVSDLLSHLNQLDSSC